MKRHLNFKIDFRRTTIIILTVLITVPILGCNDLFTNPQGGQNNLLRNPTFEIGSNLSFKNWETISFFIGFSKDTPNRFCKWSAKLNTFNPLSLMPVAFQLYQTVKLPAGKKVYNFSFWAKEDSGYDGEAKIVNNNFIKTITVNDSAWNNYSIIDTINTVSGDSVTVEFFGGYSNSYNGGKLLVDICYLTIN